MILNDQNTVIVAKIYDPLVYLDKSKIWLVWRENQSCIVVLKNFHKDTYYCIYILLYIHIIHTYYCIYIYTLYKHIITYTYILLHMSNKNTNIVLYKIPSSMRTCNIVLKYISTHMHIYMNKIEWNSTFHSVTLLLISDKGSMRHATTSI